MNSTHCSKHLWVLPLAVGAVLVPAAGAQVMTARPTAAPQTQSVRLQNARAFNLSALRRVWPAERSVQPARPGRIVANANPATFSDPTGDSGTAPDITGVVVSNKATQITFRINVVKLVVPSDGHLLIAIDSDHNTSTGYNGADYAFLGDLSTNSFDVGRWNGTDFVTTNEPTATASTDPTGLTFSINSSDLGNTTAFSFWLRSVQGSRVAAGNHDDAPDAGTWDYQLAPSTALELTVGLVATSKARAGRPFTAAIEVVRSDGANAMLSPTDVSCAARAGTAALKARAIVGEGPAAGCAWLLPKRSRGKTLHASVTAALDGASVTRKFTTRIK